MSLIRLQILALVMAALSVSACVPLVAGTAGALIVDEGIVEDDGRFDPLENTVVGEKIYE